MEQKQPSLIVLQVLNVVAFVVVVIMNVLSNSLPINGRTPQEISDALPSYFTPAGYTFSIWGVIYLALAGFVVYQALPRQRERLLIQRIGWLFVLSGVANVGWILAWHYGYYTWSVGFMLLLLLTLMTLYLRLRIGRVDPALNVSERLFVQLPFSLYLGWITVATIANIASVLGHLGWDGFGIAGPVWSAIMMGVAVIVVGLLLWNRRNLSYAAVIVWALFGIRGAYPGETAIATTAVVAAVLVAIIAVVGYVNTARREPKDSTTPAAAAGD
jgi:translocator protein